MDILPLPPMTAESRVTASVNRLFYSEGFVDEAVVSAMIARGVYGWVARESEGLVLSSSEDDYAGWAMPHYHRVRRDNSLVTSALPV